MFKTKQSVRNRQLWEIFTDLTLTMSNLETECNNKLDNDFLRIFRRGLAVLNEQDDSSL